MPQTHPKGRQSTNHQYVCTEFSDFVNFLHPVGYPWKPKNRRCQFWWVWSGIQGYAESALK